MIEKRQDRIIHVGELSNALEQIFDDVKSAKGVLIYLDIAVKFQIEKRDGAAPQARFTVNASELDTLATER